MMSDTCYAIARETRAAPGRSATAFAGRNFRATTSHESRPESLPPTHETLPAGTRLLDLLLPSRGPAQIRCNTQTSIVGAKVVAPLRDAVGFVDHEAGDPQLAEQSQELIRREPFGRDIQQP